MTSPSLIPALDGRQLTVDYALKQPTILRQRIAKLVDTQILLPKFFRPLGGKVTGGAILYNTIQSSDLLLATSIEKRSPGAEYKVVEGVDPDPQLALVEDWGGKFFVPDEVTLRNNISFLDQQTTQLANTITRKLDVRTVEELAAADIGSFAPSAGWEDLVFVGPLDGITPSADRPTAHFAQVQELSDLEELGVVHDLLVVHPEQARQLRVAYAEHLDDMLKSAGLEMFSNPRIAAGTAYVLEKGAVGTIGFELPLLTDVWPDKARRGSWVQSYCVPAFAVDRAYAAKTITGLS
jgi:hypothetical protein